MPVAEQLQVGGYDTALPCVDIHTIDAGGGTIARVDAAGLLHVGPHGAGAIPGPAAYGLGGEEPTVTDALLVLGRLKAGPYAGGSVVLDESLARHAIATCIAEPLSLSVEDAAVGIVRLLEQNVLQAVERMTLERGLDPRLFTLVSAGGAGPMHGASIGRRLGCRELYIARLSGAFCALGMLHVDVRHDLMRAFFHPLDEAHDKALEQIYITLENEAGELLRADGFDAAQQRLAREMDLRYIGQQWSIRVSVEATDQLPVIRAKFEAAHEARFRHTQPDGIVEITALRLVACGLIDKLQLPTIGKAQDLASPYARRRMYVDESHAWVDAGVYAGRQLRAGHMIAGPAIIEEQTTTICIAPLDRAEVDGYGNYRVRLAH